MLGLGLMAILVAVGLLFPDAGIGLVLKRWLIDGPVRALDQIRPGKLIFYGLLTALGLTLILVFGPEGLRLFGLMLPETVMWFVMFDVGVFVDALLITGAILASNGLRAIRSWVSAVPRQAIVRVARRASRARRSGRPPSRSGPGDEDGPGWQGQPPYLPVSMA